MTLIVIKHPQDLARLRRLALAAQGLLQNQPYGRSLPGARRAINHLGYVQIDTISVVERAHHHVLYSRVPGFKPGTFPGLTATCRFFRHLTIALYSVNDLKHCVSTTIK